MVRPILFQRLGEIIASSPLACANLIRRLIAPLKGKETDTRISKIAIADRTSISVNPLEIGGLAIRQAGVRFRYIAEPIKQCEPI